MAAGYSGTPLIKKLGIKPGTKLALINPPDNYMELLDADVNGQLAQKNEKPDMIHLFAKDRKALDKGLQQAKKIMHPNTAIWISWYKKSSGIATDVTEDIIREHILPMGLVDIKVCAVSDAWSGLKCVVPVKLRE